MTTVDVSPQVEEAHVAALAGSFTIPSGSPVDIGEGQTARAEGWQTRAWDAWHRLGEIRYPTSFLARQATRLTWHVQLPGQDEPLDDKASSKLIAEATEGIGEDEASRLIVLNLQVAGEGYYARDDKGFHVYSVLEAGLDKKRAKARKVDPPIDLRFYYPDPTDSTKAESAIRTALDPAEELLTLTALSRAQSRSRIAQAGLLLVPAEQSFASGDPFGTDLEAAMMAPIADERSPAAMVPIKIEMASELIEKVKHLPFPRKYDEQVPAKIEAATKRIALAGDYPAEFVLGNTDLNHWTAWLNNSEVYNAHLGTFAVRCADVFAEVIEILHPEMKGVIVIPDPSAILSRKSTIRDALDAYNARPPAVSAAYVRETMGATDEDAPEEEELAAARANEVREPSVEENPGEPVAASMTINTLTGDRYSEGQIAGAVAMAIDQARSKVGAKLRTKLRGSPDGVRLEKVPNSQCASICHDHLGDIDVDSTILEALVPFMTWWEGQGFDLSAREARLLVASHVKDTLGMSTTATIWGPLLMSLRP